MLILSIFQGKLLLANHHMLHVLCYLCSTAPGTWLHLSLVQLCSSHLQRSTFSHHRQAWGFFFQDCISFQWEAGTGSSLALQEFSLACSSHPRTDTECLLCARSSARLFKWGRYTWWQNLRYCQQGSAAIEGSSGPFPKQARVTYNYDASSKSILLYQSTACSLTQLPESLSSGEPEGSILSTHAFYLT